MSQEYRVIASVYRSLVSILEQNGYSPDEISERVGTDVKEIAAPQASLGLDTVTALWKFGHEVRGATIGIEAAQQVRLVDFQDVGVFLTSTEDIAELMSQLDHYSGLFSNVMEYKATQTDAGLEISILYHPQVSLKHERLEFLALAGPVLSSQYLTTPLALVSVELTRPKPENTQPWDDAFGVKVKWNAEVTKYIISEEEAHRFVITRNEQVKQDLQMLLDKRLRGNKVAHPLDDIRTVINEQLEQETPSVESVAAAIHTSTRTLQRRISQAGTSFSELLAELREESAKHYMSVGLSASEVAERLGYSDLPTFNRAFKRWVGMTPTQYAEHLKRP